MRLKIVLVPLLLAMPAAAQYEFGLHGNVSAFQSKTIANSRRDADAGFAFGYGGGVTLGHNQYRLVGGELRYNFLQNKMKLSSGGTKAEFSGESHTVHYDILVHMSDRESRIRPYLAVGGGVRLFRGTGSEAAFQPLSEVAILTRTSETKGLVSLGAGLKLKVSDRITFRLDVHDYLTRFPTEVITPAMGSSVGGWIHNIVPSAGVTFTF